MVAQALLNLKGAGQHLMVRVEVGGVMEEGCERELQPADAYGPVHCAPCQLLMSPQHAQP